ncbi:phospho-2-dehydro-3-deoxyheptonate aldolase, partial [Salmonella enterica subsp. enterica serovar Kentucky]|nr:phospho-2-dehydro-3-deoxyheptonate aldolase [Salmonella enterica subsp. enterica serovar Kentucky]EAY9355024.1 phospho-2-dehydro-3-deoxyheptonate aldolase [Salmonella enterica]EDQ4679593.1 phospho-2-dehydro-3-deoxyheptonate aldolase [Salmonella enterica subsp. enterica serovar Saintpaul]EEV8692507.1 phospho-2-dehydro-3-deoxyheptonate aldolase [Escherichia coli]EBM8702535.1 phospho-2-dehydro-3-deoxyheptonate aldolase [Salmonella enterica subsp. enterica serovar Kentucky]
MVSLLLMNAYHGNRQNNYYQLWQHSFNFNYCTYIAFKGGKMKLLSLRHSISVIREA